MSEKKEVRASGGVGLGTIIALIISWTTWNSIPWLILHGALGWVYVVYYFIKYGIPE